MLQAFHPDFAGVINITVEPLSADPDTAVAQTIARMAQYVKADQLSEILRSIARPILDSSDSEQTAARACFEWIKAHVVFKKDSDTARPVLSSPLTREVLIRPVDLVRMPRPAGDCDCQSMLMAALLGACGISSCFVTVAADFTQPGVYSHVYVRALFSDGSSMPLDASHGYYAGWEVDNFLGKRRDWSIDSMFISGASLGDLGDTLTLPDGSVVDMSTTANTDVVGSIDTGTSDSSIDWNSILQDTVTGGLKILNTVFAVPNLPSGSYMVKQRDGSVVMANNVPGAVPGTVPGGFGVPSNIGRYLPWVIGGAAVVAVALAFRGRR